MQNDPNASIAIFQWVISGVCSVGVLVLGFFGNRIRNIETDTFKKIESTEKDLSDHKVRIWRAYDELKDGVHDLETDILKTMATKEDLAAFEKRLLDAINKQH